MMNKLIIRNGIVFDPMNKIEGEKKDILIENGIIVEKFSNQSEIKEIDANNKTVIPAAIDIHSHIASQEINWVRLMGSKNKLFQDTWKGLTLNYIAKQYIKNGYTFILDANILPSMVKHAIFNLNNLPVIDSGFLLNVSNLWPLELEFQKGMVKQASIFLSNLLTISKGFGLKVYNPFESENWNYQKTREDLNQGGRLYNFKPIDIYENLTKYAEQLSLPHSIHAHVEGYENPNGKKNLMLVLNRIKSLGLQSNSVDTNNTRSQIFHLAHASSYNYDGNNTELIQFFNDNINFDLDLGVISFDPINPLITNDRILINSLQKSDPDYKIFKAGIEAEGDTYSTLRKFDKNNKVHCTLWNNAIELALSIKNKWQIQLSCNFPNYSNISNIPKIATWLMSQKARKEFSKNLNIKSRNDINSSITFNEFVIISRSSPSKSLGLGNYKGNLGIGADADLNILNLDLTRFDTEKDYQVLEKELENIEFVIKSGKIIKNGDGIDFNSKGKVFWASGKAEEEEDKFILSKKRDYYQKYYSIFYDTLKVPKNEKLFRQIR
ncbi:MAG: amidohydrolase family protein [Promethearchaeota archaeon]